MLKLFTLQNEFIEETKYILRIFTGIIENENGTRCWYLNNKIHRLYGPAIEYSSGTKLWYLNGERHRIDGPAIEYRDGTKEYWINNQQVTEEQYKLYVDIMKLKGLL